MVPLIKKQTIFHFFKENLNLEGLQHPITGSIVTAILLNGLIFPIGQISVASRWRVCYQQSLPCLVFFVRAMAQTTNGHRNLETEFAKQANLVKIA